MWWYPHLLNSTTKCDQIWNCLALILGLIQIIYCFMMVCLSLHGLLCGTGMLKCTGSLYSYGDMTQNATEICTSPYLIHHTSPGLKIGFVFDCI